MAKVLFRNPRSGETRRVKLGFSWTLLFFAGFLGIPLFLRKLNTLGLVMLAIWVTNFLLVNVPGAYNTNTVFAYYSLNLTIIGIVFWLAFKGNEMTAKHLLDLGWQIAEPDVLLAQRARAIWNVMEAPTGSELPVVSARAVEPRL